MERIKTGEQGVPSGNSRAETIRLKFRRPKMDGMVEEWKDSAVSRRVSEAIADPLRQMESH